MPSNIMFTSDTASLFATLLSFLKKMDAQRQSLEQNKLNTHRFSKKNPSLKGFFERLSPGIAIPGESLQVFWSWHGQ